MKRLVALLLIFCVLQSGVALAEREGAAHACTPVSKSDEGVLSNIELAAASLAGYYLPYGSRFSFLDAIGPCEADQGYLPADNGCGKTELGGGIAQVASTLYMALEQLSGRVEYEDLRFFGDAFSGDYVKSGDQALDISGEEGLDFSFYNYAADLVVEMYTDGEYVYCALTPSDGAEPWNAEKRMVGSASLRISGTEALKNNVALACGSINDVTLGPGDVFSFNDVVGPRISEYGYLPAVNGRGVEVVGGGVAQAASALFLALKDLDCVAIEEKSVYGGRYNQNYVSNPLDAVLVDYDGGIDFAFSYTGRDLLTVYINLEDGQLSCELYETSSW